MRVFRWILKKEHTVQEIAVDDHNGIVNGSNSFIKKLTILANGKEVYSCNEANHVANIKNLLEYNSSYAKSIGTKEFYYPDTRRSADERAAQATYNVGYALRKKVLGVSALVNCEIPLKVYISEIFFICLIESIQCFHKESKKIFSIAIFLPRVLTCQKREISLPVSYCIQVSVSFALTDGLSDQPQVNTKG